MIRKPETSEQLCGLNIWYQSTRIRRQPMEEKPHISNWQPRLPKKVLCLLLQLNHVVTGPFMQFEIKHFQRSVNLLIPLLSFNRVIREVAQDFHYDLCFQSSAILALQEACEMFLVQLFKSANLSCIHRNCQTMAPKDFYVVKSIWHIAGINLWWK